ncbi:MAG: hypothetical protein SGARI_003996 [Bacillariaceae sp.]
MKKCITFNTRVSVRRTIHISHYTDEEVNACWFSTNEYSAIRNHVRETIFLVEDGKVSDADDCQLFCRRGLEGFTSEGMDGRRRRRAKAKLSVFDEQDRQYEAGEDMDDVLIGKAYRKRCRSSRDIALIIGLVDERVALGESVQPALLNDLFSVASTAQNSKAKTEITVNAKNMKSRVTNQPVISQPVATRMMPSAA